MSQNGEENERISAASKLYSFTLPRSLSKSSSKKEEFGAKKAESGVSNIVYESSKHLGRSCEKISKEAVTTSKSSSNFVFIFLILCFGCFRFF